MCALAIALHREMRVTGTDFETEVTHLFKVMDIEKYDIETYQNCRRLMNHYRAQAKKELVHHGLLQKYACTGVVIFSDEAHAANRRERESLR